MYLPQRTLESMPPKIPPINRQRSCPCIFFSGPFANPELRPVGLGHLAVGDSPRGSPWNGCGLDRCTFCVNQHTWTAAPAGVMAGALPPHPRDLTHWGRQHGVGISASPLRLAEGETKQAASGDAARGVWPRRRRNRSGTAGRLPYRPRRPDYFTKCQRPLPTNPHHASGPNALNLGGTGAEPLSSQPPAKLSLHCFGGPFANPALRRVGLGHLAGGDSPRGSPWNGCRSATV